MKLKNIFKHEKCPLCRTSEIYKVGLIEYVFPGQFSSLPVELSAKPEFWKCRNCKSGFVQNILAQETAARLYSEGVSGERWSKMIFKEAKTKEVTDQLGLVFKRDIEVLDIGCNTGELLDFAKSCGCKTSGVEFSQDSRKILRNKGHVAFSSINEVKGGCFDVITAFDLIEHLYDVESFISFCRDKLRERGVLVILTGNISSVSARITGSKWWYLRYPEHIVFPSKKYFKALSKFRIEKWIYTYASRGYKHNILETLKSSTPAFLMGRYNGLPSLGPDHVLAVLRK